MNNADMPAMPIVVNGRIVSANDHAPEKDSMLLGLTKREQACITLGVPETGDEELDALIRKSERKRIAAILMAAWVSHHGESGEYKYNSGQAAINSVLDADALLKELEK